MAPGPAPKGSGMGCATAIAIAFGIVIVLGMLTCGGAAYWALSPGTQAETARLVGAESLGYVEVVDLSTSPALTTLLKDVFEELERRNPRSAAGPEWLRSLQSARRDYQSLLNYLLPNSFVVALEPAENGVDWVSAANFSGFTRPAKLLLARTAESRAAKQVPYKDVTIYEFPQVTSLTFLDGTFVAAEGLPAAQRAVDRLLDSQPRRAPLLDLKVPRPGSWDVRSVLTGPAALMLGIGPDLTTTARLGLRLDDPDTASGYLVVDCAGEAEAANVERALGERLANDTEGWREQGLEVEYQLVRKASAVEVDLQFQGLHEYLLTRFGPDEEEDSEAAEAEMDPGEVPPEEESLEDESSAPEDLKSESADSASAPD